jgi:SDR family mycofactocin-dependent oxidoreductase
VGRVEGKVAFITGAARGQGREHAIRLAEEGADIIAIDLCAQIETVSYPLATPADLEETVGAVKALGRRVVARVADVRDAQAVKAAADAGVEELGRLDIVIANAGIGVMRAWDEVTPELWRETIETNLTGAWNTCVVTIPHLISAAGGSIIITSSTAGLKGQPFMAPYAASKHGVVGIMRALCNELGKHSIRVNTVHPTGVPTPMAKVAGELERLLAANPELAPLFMNTLPIAHTEARDVANAVLFLASDESRHVTGLELKVDAGANAR